MVRMRMRMTMTMMTSDRTIFLLYIKYIFDLRPGAWWTGVCWDPSWTAPSPTLIGIIVSHSCFHFHWSYFVSANVPTSEAAVLSGALPSQVHLHITRWTSDHMTTWWSPDDQLVINSTDDQLIITLSLIQTPSGLFAINVCRTWKVAWGEVEGEGSQIRGDQYNTSPEATYHQGCVILSLIA